MRDAPKVRYDRMCKKKVGYYYFIYFILQILKCYGFKVCDYKMLGFLNLEMTFFYGYSNSEILRLYDFVVLEFC